MAVYTILIDFALAALLIMLGQLIRSRVTFTQKFFIPSSMIAGFIGLILGPHILNILPFSENINSYPGVLIVIVFAAIGINGFKIAKGNAKKEVSRIASYGIFRALVGTLEICLPLIFSILVISKLSPSINHGFGLLLVSGFLGGHGTAAAVGNTFAELGWAEATDLAMTSATVGILAGVFGGLLFIKWAAKKGYTGYIKDFAFISGDLKTGLVSKENRGSIGSETVSSMALDPLAFHLSLLLFPSGVGVLLKTLIKNSTGVSLPTFSVAFLFALLMFLTLGIGEKGVYKYVDKKIITRISGTATDFLVFFGVAAIKVPVVLKYALPFGLLMICGIVLTFCIARFLGPILNKESWFERSIFVYGYSTGVFAIGFTLLRIVDPNNKCKALNDTALTSPFTTFVEFFAYIAGPGMLLGGRHWTFVGIYLGISVLLLVIAKIFKLWYTMPLRERKFIGEKYESSLDAIEHN